MMKMKFLALALISASSIAQAQQITVDASHNLKIRDPLLHSDIGIGTLTTNGLNASFNSLTLPSQTSGTVFAANGSTAPTFRALTSSDIASALGATPNIASNGYGWTWPQYQFFGSGNLNNNWLTTYAYGAAGTAATGLNTSQGVGISGAARTSTNTIQNGNSIGTLGFGFADGASGTSSNGSAWGFYGECRSYPGSTGYCAAQELDSTNLHSSVTVIDPYNANAIDASTHIGANVALALKSGGGCNNSTPCYNPSSGTKNLTALSSSAALLVGTNTNAFDKGIVFQCGSIGTTTCNSTGTGDAISLFPGAYLNWYNPSHASVFNFGVDPGTGLVGGLRWNGLGLAVENSAGTPNITLNPVTGNGTFSGSVSSSNIVLPSQSQNSVFAAPSNSAGAPQFRSLTTSDLPIGTTGATIPLLNGTNNWNGLKSEFTGDGFPDDISGGQFTMSYLSSISRVFANSAAYGISGMVVNHNTTSVGYPTGVVGYGQLAAAGNQAYGMNAVTDCMTNGICSNEFDANNFSTQDAPSTFPPNYNYPTNATYPQGLYLGAGGNKKDYFALGIGPNGFKPSTWNAGIWMVPGSVNYYGALIGATSSTGPQYSIYSQNVGTGPNVNMVLQTTGTYTPNNAVISVQDASATAHMYVQQSGAVSATSFNIIGTPGVSCAAGTVNLSTFTVTNGIVTHC